MAEITIQSIIRGALFGFAAHLSALESSVTLGARESAGPAADLVAEYIRKSGLGQDSEHVEHGWRELLGTITGGVSAITAERIRQVLAEGWTPEHDAQHLPQELPAAAAYYCAFADKKWAAEFIYPQGWDQKWAKREGDPIPTDRDLVKAGALIAAELDRRRAAREEEAALPPCRRCGRPALNEDGDELCEHCKEED